MIAQFFINRPIFAWVIALAILLCGVLTLRGLPISQYPSVAPPTLSVSLTYPGASAQVVEESVITLIEQEMNGVENLQYMESSSSLGQGSVNLTFESGTNLDLAMVETQNRLKRVEARLPEDVRRLGINVAKSSRNYVMFISLFSPDGSMDAVDLGSFANTTVLDSIRRVPGVGDASLFGTEYSMRIWLQPDKLYHYQLAPMDVTRALRAQNVQVAIGELGQLPASPGQQLNAVIVTQSRLSSVEEFSQVILRTNADGSVLRLKDVARVEMGAQSHDRLIHFDGNNATAIGIRLTPGANALDTVRGIKQKMTEISRFFPQGVSWAVPYDTTTFIEISIKEVVKTLVEALILVFVVMYVFLGNLRATIIPTVVIPIALVGAMVGIYLLGYSINVLTLFAMVLAIGIVVDDAIVVVENVERIITTEGLSPREATKKAMNQIIGAIVAITLVLMAVFVPMALFSGSTGVIYRQFAVTLILTMLFSALMALTLTPAMCATILKSQAGHGQGSWFNRFFEQMTQSYSQRVAKILQRSARYMLIYLLLLLVVGWMFSKLPTGFLPEEDQGNLITVIQLPAGATQERTLEVLKQVEQHYLAQPEVAHVVGVAGFSFFGAGQNAAITFVSLKDWDQRTSEDSSAMSVVARANMNLFRIKQAMIFAINPPPIGELSAVGGFDFRLQDVGSVGREQLMEARNMVLGMASKNPAIAGARPEGQEPAPQLTLSIDRLKAETLGVSVTDLNATLQSLLGQVYVNDFIYQGRVLRVQMQAESDTRRSPEDILKLSIRNNKGNMVPLSEVATISWQTSLPKLDRYNGVPAMKIAGSAAPGYSTGQVMAEMEKIASQLPPGISFAWSTTSLEEQLSGDQAPLLFAVSLLVVFLCLAALYESWSIPFAVMMVVPLGVFGALSAVLWRELPNDLYFKVGLIVIIGLSAKNAILIIEFARKLQDEGMELVAATVEASRLRLRPILMTSIAFIAGVMPLAISSGAGANSRIAIGTGVVGGMLGATLLAIFLVPVFYVVIQRLFPTPHKHPLKQGDSV